MIRSLRALILLSISILSLTFALAGTSAAQTSDSDTVYVGLVVTNSEETVTATETPTEVATATETPTETATPTEPVAERCPHAPDPDSATGHPMEYDSFGGINPNALAAGAAMQNVGTPCNPRYVSDLDPDKVAVVVTQLPNTGSHTPSSDNLARTALVLTSTLILIGVAGAARKQTS